MLVQPDHEENVSLPDIVGAVSVMDLPASYTRAKLVDPDVAPFLSAGDTVTDTPVDGFVEFTVSV